MFSAYARALGLIYAFLIVFFFLIFQVSSVFSNIWLSMWTSDTLLLNSTLVNSSIYAQTRDLYLGVYGGLGVSQGEFFLSHFIYSQPFCHFFGQIVPQVPTQNLSHWRQNRHILGHLGYPKRECYVEFIIGE